MFIRADIPLKRDSAFLNHPGCIGSGNTVSPINNRSDVVYTCSYLGALFNPSFGILADEILYGIVLNIVMIKLLSAMPCFKFVAVYCCTCVILSAGR